MTKWTWTNTRTATLVQLLFATLACGGIALPAYAGPAEQARQIHDRLAGVPPSDAVLTQMENAIAGTEPSCSSYGTSYGGSVSGHVCAAYIAMDNANFYNVTLKNFAAPWTNRDRSVFVPLNDYIATVIGMIRDDVPFNTLLSADLAYVGRQGVVAAQPAANNNTHYEQLEENNVNLKDELVETTQSSILGIPSSATAGVMTSRAASEAFFVAGTNRAMFRFTLLNHMCNDLEQVHDRKLPPDRIRQDVSRSPGGDSRLFLNNCVGCHTGMDPMAGAFAYYNYNEENGVLDYSASGPGPGGTVQPKYFNNDANFPQGYRTTDDHWENYWREGQNAYLGFDTALPGEGNGAKSLGEELGNSDAFAACQVKKAFKAVCLRNPEDQSDFDAVDQIAGTFTLTSNYSMRQVFADVAVHCMGQ